MPSISQLIHCTTKLSNSGFYVCLLNDYYCNARKYIKVRGEWSQVPGETMFLIEVFHKENKITVLVSPNDMKAYSGSRVVFRTQVQIYYDSLKVA